MARGDLVAIDLSQQLAVYLTLTYAIAYRCSPDADLIIGQGYKNREPDIFSPSIAEKKLPCILSASWRSRNCCQTWQSAYQKCSGSRHLAQCRGLLPRDDAICSIDSRSHRHDRERQTESDNLTSGTGDPGEAELHHRELSGWQDTSAAGLVGR
jgi:hypothetical protein